MTDRIQAALRATACDLLRDFYYDGPAQRGAVESFVAALAAAPLPLTAWMPIETAPKDGKPFLAWFPQVRLDEDDDLTDETFGGAAAIISCKGRVWDEPDWLEAHGAHYFEDWCFAEVPTHWMPLPAAPDAALLSIKDDK